MPQLTDGRRIAGGKGDNEVQILWMRGAGGRIIL